MVSAHAQQASPGLAVKLRVKREHSVIDARRGVNALMVPRATQSMVPARVQTDGLAHVVIQHALKDYMDLLVSDLANVKMADYAIM